MLARLACRRQGNAFGRAVQQTHAQPRLKSLDRVAQRRCAHPKFNGSFTKTLMAGYGEKNRQDRPCRHGLHSYGLANWIDFKLKKQRYFDVMAYRDVDPTRKIKDLDARAIFRAVCLYYRRQP